MSSPTLPTGDVSRLQRELAGRARLAFGLNLLALGMFLGGTAGVGLFAYFLCDYLTRFPQTVRIVVSLAGLGLLAGWLPWRLRRLWERERDPVRIARRVEREAGRQLGRGFGSILISGLEFGLKPGSQGSRELQEAVIALAHDGRFAPRQVHLHDREWLHRGRRLGLVALAIVLPWAIFWPQALAVFAQRAVGLNRAYPTKTRIVALTYPKVSAMHQPIALRVRAAGELPGHGRVSVCFAGEAPFDLRLAPDAAEAGVFAATLENPMHDLRFQVFLGDTESEILAIRVPRAPVVLEGLFTIRAPEYTGYGTRTYPPSSFSVPEHSLLDLTVRADRDVAGCELFLGDQRLPLAGHGSGPYTLTASKLTETRRLSIRLVDKDGIENLDRLDYRLTVMPDRLPSVQMLDPENDSYWAPESNMPWRAKLSDDYGLRAATLRCAVIVTGKDGKESTQVLKDIPVAGLNGQREADVNGTVKLADLKIEPGRVLLVSLLAQDFGEGPERSRWQEAEARRINIVSASQLRTLIEEEERMVTKMAEDLSEDMKYEVRILQMQEKKKP